MALYQWAVADIALYNEWKAISKQEDQHTCMTTGKGSIRTTLLANCFYLPMVVPWEWPT